MLSTREQKILLATVTFYCAAAILRLATQIRVLSLPLSSKLDEHPSNADCPPRTINSISGSDRPLNSLSTSNRRVSNESTLVSSKVIASLLVVVPGLGDPSRIEITRQSIETIRRSLQRTGRHGFGCIIYAYKVSVLTRAEDALGSICQIEWNEGLWTHHMARVPRLNGSNMNYTHVAVMMDDVDVTQVDMVEFLNLMQWSNFGVASPAIHDFPCMDQRCQCLFHRTDFVDILFTVFHRNVWECWQHHLDPVRNPYGWGMDITLRPMCSTTLGVIDAFQATHRSSYRSYSARDARTQMARWIANKVGIRSNESQQYADCVIYQRPEAFPRCLVYWDGTPTSTTTVDWEC